jgi:hypothetical protein
MREDDSGLDQTKKANKLSRLPLPAVVLGVGSILWKLIDVVGRIDFILRVEDQTFAALFHAFVSYGWIILTVGSALWAYLAARNEPVPDGGTFKAIGGMVISVGTLAFLYGVLLAVHATGSIPNVVGAWGPTPTGCQMLVNTTRLSTFNDGYYLVATCGLTDPSTDMLQQTGITISKPFTITPGGVSIFAPFSAEMVKSLTVAPTSGTVASTSGTVAPTSGAVAPTNGAIAPTNGAVGVVSFPLCGISLFWSPKTLTFPRSRVSQT